MLRSFRFLAQKFGGQGKDDGFDRIFWPYGKSCVTDKVISYKPS
jgi:hypothetical protein